MSDELSGPTKQLFHAICMLTVIATKIFGGYAESPAGLARFARMTADKAMDEHLASPYAVHDAPAP